MSDEQQRKRFLLETEQAISEINREIIHERIPKITKDSVLPLATTVARMRARYLESAFELAAVQKDQAVSENILNDLRHNRELYEESRNAFEALTRAIEMGYVDLDD